MLGVLDVGAHVLVEVLDCLIRQAVVLGERESGRPVRLGKLLLVAPPGGEAFGRALSLSPDNSDVLNNFGWFLCTRNDTQRGLEMMSRAAADTQYQTPEKAWLSIGLCQRRAGRAAEAEDALRRAVLIRPDMIGALYNLAQVTFERGATKDAENYLGRYMRMATPNLEALVLGVRVARANGDKASEESYLQQLRRRFPDAPQLRELEAGR